MAGGRPTKYDPKYCEELIEHGKQGGSFRSFAGKIGVIHQTLYAWEAEHKEFLDAKRLAEEYSFYWWEKVAKAAMMGQIPNFNNIVWVFSMKNRFGWRDKVEIDSRVELTENKEIIYETRWAPATIELKSNTPALPAPSSTAETSPIQESIQHSVLGETDGKDDLRDKQNSG